VLRSQFHVPSVERATISRELALRTQSNLMAQVNVEEEVELGVGHGISAKSMASVSTVFKGSGGNVHSLVLRGKHGSTNPRHLTVRRSVP
jgi:hypothetical protein